MMAWRRGGRGGKEEQQEQKERKEQQEELATVTVPHASRTAEGNGERTEESTVVCVVCKEELSQENTAKSREKEHRKAQSQRNLGKSEPVQELWITVANMLQSTGGADLSWKGAIIARNAKRLRSGSGAGRKSNRLRSLRRQETGRLRPQLRAANAIRST